VKVPFPPHEYTNVLVKAPETGEPAYVLSFCQTCLKRNYENILNDDNLVSILKNDHKDAYCEICDAVAVIGIPIKLKGGE